MDVGESPSMQERLPWASQSAPCIAMSVRKKKRAVIIGDSSEGNRGPDMPLGPIPQGGVLPGAWVRDVARNIALLVKPSIIIHYWFSTLEMKR